MESKNSVELFKNQAHKLVGEENVPFWSLQTRMPHTATTNVFPLPKQRYS